MLKKKNITGIILAGGKSSRMGTDKGLLKIQHKTFIELIILAMIPLVEDILIVSNNSIYDKFGYTRLEDIIKNSGPLAGIYTGLSHTKTDYNLILSCDVPLVTTTLLYKLVTSNYKEYDLVQIESENKTMPLIALYHKRCKDTCLELLQNDERRLRLAVKQLNCKSISVDETFKNQIKNINTKDDLKHINYAIEY